MFKTYDLCNSCAYICEPHLGMFDLVACCHRWVNETSQRRASVAVVMTVGSEPNCQQAGLGWWWWIMGTWWHQLRWRKYAMFFLFKTPPVSWCFQICAFIFKRIWWWSQLIYIYILEGVKPPSRVLMSLDFFGVFYFKNNVWLFGGPTPLWFIRLYELGMT